MDSDKYCYEVMWQWFFSHFIKHLFPLYLGKFLRPPRQPAEWMEHSSWVGLQVSWLTCKWKLTRSQYATQSGCTGEHGGQMFAETAPHRSRAGAFMGLGDTQLFLSKYISICTCPALWLVHLCTWCFGLHLAGYCAQILIFFFTQYTENDDVAQQQSHVSVTGLFCTSVQAGMSLTRACQGSLAKVSCSLLLISLEMKVNTDQEVDTCKPKGAWFSRSLFCTVSTTHTEIWTRRMAHLLWKAVQLPVQDAETHRRILSYCLQPHGEQEWCDQQEGAGHGKCMGFRYLSYWII